MKKTIITIALIAVAAVGFRPASKPFVTQTMPCVVIGVDTLPQGLVVHVRPAGEWSPLKSFPKKPKDTLWVYKVAAD